MPPSRHLIPTGLGGGAVPRRAAGRLGRRDSHRSIQVPWKEAALPSFVYIPRVACPVRTNRLAPRPSVFLTLTRKTKGRSTQA